MKICELHRQLPWCMGCGRTLPEIEQWASATNSEKREILQKLSARLAFMTGQSGVAS
jgi:predicted Fe-S protein YdhL (DUF1289 family)